MDRGDIFAAILGGLFGLVLAGYFFMYLPMKVNYAECGKVTLCR